MLHDVVRRCRRRRRRWAHAPVIHAASHFYQEKRVASGFYFYACMCSCYHSYGAPLGGPSSRRSSAIIPRIFEATQDKYQYNTSAPMKRAFLNKRKYIGRFSRPGFFDVIRCVNFDRFASSQCFSFKVSAQWAVLFAFYPVENSLDNESSSDTSSSCDAESLQLAVEGKGCFQ